VQRSRLRQKKTSFLGGKEEESSPGILVLLAFPKKLEKWGMTPPSRAHLEAFKAKLLAGKNPDAKVIY